MQTTNHCKQRKEERKINDMLIETTIQYGTQLSQNPSRIIFGSKELQSIRRKKSISKNEYLNLEKQLSNRTIVIVIGETLITAFWATKRINKRFKNKNKLSFEV